MSLVNAGKDEQGREKCVFILEADFFPQLCCLTGLPGTVLQGDCDTAILPVGPESRCCSVILIAGGQKPRAPVHSVYSESHFLSLIYSML